MRGIAETEAYDIDDNDTIQTPMQSPDSVLCFPPRLTPIIGKGSSIASGPSEQELISVAQSSNTNGSDSTWRPSSLLGSDGVPWWEDEEGSNMPGTSNDDAQEDATIDNSVQSATLEPADVASEEVHASLIVLMEALKTGEFPPANKNLSRSSRSLGDLNMSVDISECDSSVTGEEERVLRKKSGKASSNKVGESADGDRETSSRQASSSIGCQVLHKNRVVPSIDSSESVSSGTGSEANATKPKRRSSGPKSRESTAPRPRSHSGAHAMDSYDNEYSHEEEGRYQRRSSSYGERAGRPERRSSTAGRRRSLSSGRLVTPATSRSRSSRALTDSSDDYKSSSHGDELRRTRSDPCERRGSTASRRRSMSIGRLDPESRPRSSRRLHDSSDEDDYYGHRSRSSRRHDRADSSRRRRSKSSHRRLSEEFDDDGDFRRERPAGRSSHLRESRDRSDRRRPNDLSSSRHRSSRSSHRRDLGSFSHHGNRNDESYRRRRSPSRHDGDSGSRRHRSRSRTMKTRSSSDEEPEPKVAVKEFIKGLLKESPPSSRHPTESSSRQQQKRRQSCGGLGERRSHRTNRRPSGKHI